MHTKIHTHIEVYIHNIITYLIGQAGIKPVFSDEEQTMKLASCASITDNDVLFTYRGLVLDKETRFAARDFVYEYDGQDGIHGWDGESFVPTKAMSGFPVCVCLKLDRAFCNKSLLHDTVCVTLCDTHSVSVRMCVCVYVCVAFL